MKAAKGKQRELAWHGKPTPGLLEALAVTAVHRDPGLLSKWDRISCNFQSILSILALNYIFIKLSASCVCVCVCVLSHIQLVVTPRTIAHRFLCAWNFPGKNTGVGYHFLLQGIFLTQGSNQPLLHYRQILNPLSHLRRPHGGS